METSPHIIGYIGAFLTTVCFVPQVVKIVRERQTAGISLTMYLVYVVGLFCWLAYGVLLMSWPMIVANIVTISLVFVIIGMKIKLG